MRPTRPRPRRGSVGNNCPTQTNPGEMRGPRTGCADPTRTRPGPRRHRRDAGCRDPDIRTTCGPTRRERPLISNADLKTSMPAGKPEASIDNRGKPRAGRPSDQALERRHEGVPSTAPGPRLPRADHRGARRRRPGRLGAAAHPAPSTPRQAAPPGLRMFDPFLFADPGRARRLLDTETGRPALTFPTPRPSMWSASPPGSTRTAIGSDRGDGCRQRGRESTALGHPGARAGPTPAAASSTG